MLSDIVLIAWPLIAIVIFLNRPISKVFVWAIIPPYLLLPEATAVSLPGAPDLDKTNVIALGLILGLVVAKKDAPPVVGTAGEDQVPAVRKLQNLLIAGIFIGSVFTIMTNSESIRIGETFLPGLSLWEGLSKTGDLFLFLVPFFMARKYLINEDTIHTLLVALAVSALCYTALMLIEIRISPQLHRMVYGFHQHQFNQHVRGGYRPMVFLQHGLWVGFYTYAGLVASLALWRLGFGVRWLLAAAWLFIMLFLSRNFGAFAIGVFSIGALLFLTRRTQMLLAACIGAAVLIYPALRQAQLIPFDSILGVVGNINQNRANSLAFRLGNEDALLARAAEKPLLGWGGWGRQLIYDNNGRRISVSEGRWIQTIGARGWVGYVFFFGMLTVPIFILAFRRGNAQAPPALYPLGILAAGNLFYMIPNSTLTPVGLLVFGALAGCAQTRFGARKDTDAVSQEVEPVHPRSRYTRFPSGAPTPR